jgi:hypothetical protein
MTECGPKGAARVGRIAAVRDCFVDVRLQLFVNLGDETFAPHDVRQAGPP